MRDKADKWTQSNRSNKVLSDNNAISVGLSYILLMRCNIRATVNSRGLKSVFYLEWLDKITMSPDTTSIYLGRQFPVALPSPVILWWVPITTTYYGQLFIMISTISYLMDRTIEHSGRHKQFPLSLVSDKSSQNLQSDQEGQCSSF